MKIFCGILGFVCMVGCTSKKFGDQQIQTQLETSGNKSSEKMGFDKERNLLIQEKATATEELLAQQHVNEELQSKLQHEYQLLKRCRTETADIRLGGTGELAPLPEVDGLKNDPTVKENVGIDESGELVFVRQENFEDRFKAERQFEKSLRRISKVVVSNREQCEMRMRRARVEHGLPAERMPAVTRMEGGQIIIVRPAERNLDDAFQFINEAKQK